MTNAQGFPEFHRGRTAHNAGKRFNANATADWQSGWLDGRAAKQQARAYRYARIRDYLLIAGVVLFTLIMIGGAITLTVIKYAAFWKIATS